MLVLKKESLFEFAFIYEALLYSVLTVTEQGTFTAVAKKILNHLLAELQRSIRHPACLEAVVCKFGCFSSSECSGKTFPRHGTFQRLMASSVHLAGQAQMVKWVLAAIFNSGHVRSVW